MTRKSHYCFGVFWLLKISRRALLQLVYLIRHCVPPEGERCLASPVSVIGLI